MNAKGHQTWNNNRINEDSVSISPSSLVPSTAFQGDFPKLLYSPSLANQWMIPHSIDRSCPTRTGIKGPVNHLVLYENNLEPKFHPSIIFRKTKMVSAAYILLTACTIDVAISILR
jgi:hypothetical protein